MNSSKSILTQVLSAAMLQRNIVEGETRNCDFILKKSVYLCLFKIRLPLIREFCIEMFVSLKGGEN